MLEEPEMGEDSRFVEVGAGAPPPTHPPPPTRGPTAPTPAPTAPGSPPPPGGGYVEALQQAHSEYSQSIKEADMLESHIIQARARAAATESQACERIREDQDHQRLPIVKSAFCWCVDQDLLELNNLISPREYLTSQKPRVQAPTAIKSNPGRPTITYSMHVSRDPQDDGYTLMQNPEKIVPEMNTSDLSLTFESSSDTTKTKKTPREDPNQTKARPKWRGELSAKDRAEGWEKLQKMKDRQNFLRNPRFLPLSAQQGGTSLVRPRTKAGKTEHVRKEMQEQSSTDVPVFLAKPSVVLFTDYSLGHVYETTLELQNLTSASRAVRVIPPTTPFFSIGLGRFPGEGGVVAPGLSCKYTVRFAPDSLGDYEDFIMVETQGEHLLVVPVAASRLPPILTCLRGTRYDDETPPPYAPPNQSEKIKPTNPAHHDTALLPDLCPPVIRT